MVYLLLFLALAGAAFDGAEMSAESRANLEVLTAALEAARSQHTGLSASIDYEVKATSNVQSYVPDQHVVGSLRWDGKRVAYVLFRAGEPEVLSACVARDWRRLFRAERNDHNYTHPTRGRVDISVVTFGFRPAAGSVSGVLQDRFAVVDPAAWFGGTTLVAIKEGVAESRNSDLEVRADGDAMVLRCKLHHGAYWTVWFDANKGYLPIRGETRDPGKAKGFESDERHEWELVAGKWALKNLEWEQRWYDGASKAPAKASHKLVFSDVKVAERFRDSDFDPETLPLPLGALGTDNRVVPPAGLIKDKKAIVQRAKASAEATKAMAEANAFADGPGAGDDDEARRAAAERSIYYWQWASRALGGLAFLVLAIGLMRWRLRR